MVGNPQRFAQAVFVSVVARDPENKPVKVAMDFKQGATLQPHVEDNVTFNAGGVKRRCFGCFGSGSSASALLLIAGVVLLGRRVWRA